MYPFAQDGLVVDDDVRDVHRLREHKDEGDVAGARELVHVGRGAAPNEAAAARTDHQNRDRGAKHIHQQVHDQLGDVGCENIGCGLRGEIVLTRRPPAPT